jgi:hypothetical protein
MTDNDQKSTKSKRLIRSPFLWFTLTLVAIITLTIISPAERTLGSHVRVVYLHGAWVWTSLILLIASGIAGLLGLLIGKPSLNCWSQALGRTGIIFWITYLPLSIWAAQANWNGLFLSEPRWRMALVFALGGLILQVGLTLVDRPALTAGANLIFISMLLFSIQQAENIMHPPSPIFDSQVLRIQLYFLALLALILLAAWQMSRWWFRIERRCVEN